jgi:transcriptional regulator with XRE-family HTH domain
MVNFVYLCRYWRNTGHNWLFMKNEPNTSDDAAIALLGERLAKHRLSQNRTQAQLAKEAGVSKRTLVRLESGLSTQLTNLVRILRALDLLKNWDNLVPAPMASPLEQLRTQGSQRKRASRRRKPAKERPAKNAWSWESEVKPESKKPK